MQLLQRRPREVADVDAAGPAGRGEVEPLDPVERDRHAAVGERAAACGGDVEVAVRRRGRVGQRVLAATAVDDDAVQGAALGRVVDRPVAVEVDGQGIRGELEGDLLVGRAARDEQRAMADLERGRRRRVDELAVTAAGHGAAEVAADRLGERAGELLVGEVGDQDQVPVERDRAAEQPSGRLLVGEQAVAERVGGDARHLELDRVDRGIARVEVVEREHGLLVEAGADRLGDLLQLGAVDAVDVEAARALERRGAEVRGEEHAVEQLRAARRAAALAHDPGGDAREAPEPVVQPRVVGVRDHRGVVGGEDLGVGDRLRGMRARRRDEGERGGDRCRRDRREHLGRGRWFIMRATLPGPAPGAHRQALPNLRACATDANQASLRVSRPARMRSSPNRNSVA